MGNFMHGSAFNRHQRMAKLICLLLVALGFLFFHATYAHATEPWPEPPEQDPPKLPVTLILQSGFNPGGMALSGPLLFIPSDSGTIKIKSLKTGFNQFTNYLFPARPFKGTAIAQNALFAILANTPPAVPSASKSVVPVPVGPPSIRRYNPDTLSAFPQSLTDGGQEWFLNDLDPIDPNSRPAGLTFLPDEFCRKMRKNDGTLYNNGQGSVFGTGGMFLASFKGTGMTRVYDIDLNNTQNVIHVRTNSPHFAQGIPNLGEISALTYHAESKHLVGIWDSAGVMGIIDDVATPGFKRTWALPPSSGHYKGVAVSGCGSENTNVILATDNGKVTSYPFASSAFPCPFQPVLQPSGK